MKKAITICFHQNLSFKLEKLISSTSHHTVLLTIMLNVWRNNIRTHKSLKLQRQNPRPSKTIECGFWNICSNSTKTPEPYIRILNSPWGFIHPSSEHMFSKNLSNSPFSAWVLPSTAIRWIVIRQIFRYINIIIKFAAILS